VGVDVEREPNAEGEGELVSVGARNSIRTGGSARKGYWERSKIAGKNRGRADRKGPGDTHGNWH